MLKLAIVCFALFVLGTSVASARLTKPTWTVATAEDALSNSDWFADNALDDLSCQGRGRAYQTPDNQPSYRVFRCSFYFQNDADEENTFTAFVRVIANPDRYSLYQFSDSSFN